MCSNYLPVPASTLTQLGRGEVNFTYPGECFPQKQAPFLASGASGWTLGVFGLLPHWATPDLARRTYNARVETVAQLPSFRSAWRRRQLALIPAMAIFEPEYSTGRPVRWRIERRDGRPFGVAGLWEHSRAADGQDCWSFSMLTINADAHPIMSHFHAPGKERRSVVVLEEAHWDAWLQAREEADVREFLRLFDSDAMRAVADPRQSPRAPSGRSTDLFSGG